MNNTNTVVVPTNGVEGNITSCGLDTANISTQRDSAFSFTEYNTYQTYNVCTGEVVKQYDVQGVTFFGGFVIFVLVIVLIFGVAGAAY